MKPEINKVKDLEATMKWLEKDNELLRMKSIAWGTLVDIVEKQFNISIKKSSYPSRRIFKLSLPVIGYEFNVFMVWFFPSSLVCSYQANGE